MKFVPDSFTVKAGQTVCVELTNNGVLIHDFVVRDGDQETRVELSGGKHGVAQSIQGADGARRVRVRLHRAGTHRGRDEGGHACRCLAAAVRRAPARRPSVRAPGRFWWLVVATVVATYLLIVIGAVVRVTGSGMGCADDWPLCHGPSLPAAGIRAVARIHAPAGGRGRVGADRGRRRGHLAALPASTAAGGARR